VPSNLSTRDRILSILRKQGQTVPQLAEILGVARNTLVFALQDLETKGLVRKGAMAHSGKAGKPAVIYEIIPQQVEAISPAYQSIAPHLLAAAAAETPDKIAPVMQAVGGRMHAQLAKALDVGGRVGLERTLEFLRGQGAEIEVKQDGEDTLALSHSCPIGLLVRADRHICSAIAALLEEATGRPVRDECIYGKKLTCRFRVKGGD